MAESRRFSKVYVIIRLFEEKLVPGNLYSTASQKNQLVFASVRWHRPYYTVYLQREKV